MEEAREKANRLEALSVGATAAAADGGTLEVGVVRALASQHVQFKRQTFSPEGRTERFQASSLAKQRDKAVKSLTLFVNRAEGAQGCSSDLLGALTAVRQQQEVETQRLGRSVKTDVIFVTNGLIVDRAAQVILTKQAIERPAVYRTVVRRIRSAFTMPDLSGMTIWLVGTGWDRNIKTERGPAVQKLWAEILRPTGAALTTPVQSADSLPPSLSG